MVLSAIAPHDLAAGRGYLMIMGVRVEFIETSSLVDRSYVVADDHAAVVIDPQRDIDRVTQVLGERSASITDVLETHLHNDYLAGAGSARVAQLSFGLCGARARLAHQHKIFGQMRSYRGQVSVKHIERDASGTGDVRGLEFGRGTHIDNARRGGRVEPAA